MPTVEADKWVQRVEEAISEEAENRKSFGERCMIFGCSLNCWGNYKTSKQAAEKVATVRNYISSTPLPDNITRVRPPPPVEELSTHSVQVPPSGEDTLRDALRCIKGDLAVGVIGIWGPDRDEKTRFLKKMNDSFLGGLSFDFFIFVTASYDCTVQNIQVQITNRLRINQHDDVATQATRISELLRKKSFLLLVDDLRVQLDLQAVGIPYPLGVVRVVLAAQGTRQVQRKKVQRKVVVTSISQSICDLMGVDKYIQVLGLEEEEACKLFEHNFGEENLYADPHVGVLAKDLVRELMDQPSELIHFGKIMRRNRDARQWEVAIDAVKRSNLRKDNPLCMVSACIKTHISKVLMPLLSTKIHVLF
jgi:hypothetical protein